MQIAVEVPDVVFEGGVLTRQELEAEVRKEVALSLYRGNRVSEGKAAQIAGLNRLAFHQLLGARGVERNYSREDLRHDLEWAEGLSKQPDAAPLKDGAQ